MHEIVLDTEAAPVRRTSRVDPQLMRVYDIGWTILDGGNGLIVEKENYVVEETFARTSLMRNAYYQDRLTWYEVALRTGAITAKPLIYIWHRFADACKAHGVKNAWAYNCAFDVKALDATIIDYSNGFVNSFIPGGMKVLDVWEYFGRTFAATRKYVQWCELHGFATTSGNPSTTAEAAYRYLTDDPTFVESHTALDDAEREAYILSRCRRYSGNVNNSAKWGNGWRKAASIAKAMKQEG